MRAFTLIRWAVSLIAFLFSSVSYGADAIEVNAYVSPAYAPNQSIYWVNDDTIIFHGTPIAQDGKAKKGGWLLEYKLSTGQLTEKGRIGSLCFDNGYVRYWRPSPETADLSLTQQKAEVFYGPYGKESQMIFPEQQKSTSSVSRRTWDCKFENEALPISDGLTGKDIYRLRPEHGYLEYEKFQPDWRVTERYPVRLHRPGATPEQAIALPDVFTKRVSFGYRINAIPRYYAYKQAYLLHTDYFRSPMRAGEMATLWWLYPDGRVEEIVNYTLGEGWPETDPGDFVPTKNGLYLSGYEPNAAYKGIGKSGIYRFKEGSAPERILSGRVGMMTLSPDGCKLAFVNDDRFWVLPSKKQHNLQVINICEGEQK